jgi:acetolactate synthase-1/2/3 large subunit
VKGSSNTVSTKYSDELIRWLIDLGYTHCFFVAGGNIMHLLDSARKNLTCIPVVHEVAAGIAAEYFNEISTSEKAFALVTAGPGITNLVTSVAGAWLEHRDLLVIGGQVKSSDLMSGSLRQRGIQEIDGVSIVSSICKAAFTLKSQVSEAEFKSKVELGTSGRKGPIFIEVCLDVQGAVPENDLVDLSDHKNSLITQNVSTLQIDLIRQLMSKAQRPVWLIGAGVSRSTAAECKDLLEKLDFPLITTWHGADRLSARSENYFGRMDTWGQRAANLIVCQADLLVVFGARLGLQETGFNWQGFATNAEIIQIEIDEAELGKGHPRIDTPIHGDANDILKSLLQHQFEDRSAWMEYCKKIKHLLPLNETTNQTNEGYISPYEFYLDASTFSDSDDVWVPASSGGANSVAIQALQQWGDQKVVCDNGLASMGYGLSGAIGASFAAPDQRVWLVEGDGGFSQNLQELATVAVNLLNIKIFIFSNNGYGSIRTTQRNYFDGAYLGCDTETGLGFPDWHILANAYGIPSTRFPEAGFNDANFAYLLGNKGPLLVVVPIDPEQTYWPKITSFVTASGGMASNPIHHMSPDLPISVQKQVGVFL